MITLLFQSFIILSVATSAAVILKGWLQGGSWECWCGELATHPGGACRRHGGR